MPTIIDGKAIAARLRAEMACEVAILKERGITPSLATVLVGEDPASEIYVRMKGNACHELGMHSVKHALPAETTEAELLTLVERLNSDPAIHGILVQLPLPKQVNTDTILEAISPAKDVDGFHPCNVGRLVVGKPTFQPCTPRGVMVMLREAGVELAGKEVVVVGRSNIVGKPVALLCLQQHATVTICHSRTRDLPSKVRAADVLIAAVGVPEMIKGEWIKEGAVVVDVGINRVGGKTLVGDVEFAEASRRASAITPVPGGVGPMTITMLLHNTLEAAKKAGTGDR